MDDNDEEALETLKQYCKNDVRMTALVLLYLLHYKKVFIEGEEITFSLDEIIDKANREIKENPNMRTEQNMFE
jgi:hypothetical protein